jgi:hypothetical protein
MGSIEFYGEQMDNFTILITDTISAYKKVVLSAYHCGKCGRDSVPDFTDWNPTKDYNHAFDIVRLLENFGYTGYDYDTVFYTFTLDCPNPDSGHDDWRFEGDGLNFGQAVCNTLIKFANEYTFIDNKSGNK